MLPISGWNKALFRHPFGRLLCFLGTNVEVGPFFCIGIHMVLELDIHRFRKVWEVFHLYVLMCRWRPVKFHWRSIFDFTIYIRPYFSLSDSEYGGEGGLGIQYILIILQFSFLPHWQFYYITQVCSYPSISDSECEFTTLPMSQCGLYVLSVNLNSFHRLFHILNADMLFCDVIPCYLLWSFWIQMVHLACPSLSIFSSGTTPDPGECLYGTLTFVDKPLYSFPGIHIPPFPVPLIRTWIFRWYLS